jgi:hypothetical protein
MARGNMVDIVDVHKKFGIYIIRPTLKSQSFKPYDYIYVSKAGTLIGRWGKKPYQYRDYISSGWRGFRVARRTDHYIFLARQ